MPLRTQKIILNWLAVLLWLAVIYYFSDQPDLKSSLSTFWDTFFRKIAHMAEFFVLAFLVYRALIVHSVSSVKAATIAAAAAISYAFFDEWHQTWVAGRSGSLIDVGIDSVGVLIFYGLSKMKKHESLFNK